MNREIVFRVDHESFFVELVLLAEGDLRDLWTVVVVETVDVVHDFRLVGFNRGDDEEILEFLVLTEFVVVEDDFFEEGDQEFREISVHEGFDGG